MTSRWVVNLPSSHHSFLPLVNRIKCSAWPQDGCQDIFWTEYQFEAVTSKTCYVNVSRVTAMCWEENLNSQVLFGVWGRAREPRGGSGSVISPGWKTEKRRCVDLLWGLKSNTWLEWEGSSCTFTPGSQSVLSSLQTPSHVRLKEWWRACSDDTNIYHRSSVLGPVKIQSEKKASKTAIDVTTGQGWGSSVNSSAHRDLF